MALRISEDQIELVREEGEKSYPSECCGFLLGKTTDGGKCVLRVKPSQNSAAKPNQRNRYIIDPLDYLENNKSARSRGEEILGFFHSHPDAEARPSIFDTEHAWPWYSYIIVSVKSGRAEALTSWILKDDRSGFDEEEILPSKLDNND